MRIALTGNPNSGKTTMYNALTGRNEKVGNWAGVTVDKKEHPIKKVYAGGEQIIAVDLPGAYSMSPFTSEESITSSYVKNENPDVIINIVDADNLSRSLFFTTQLLELGIPVVVAVNKSDIGKKKGNKIDIDALSAKLGCPVIKTVSTSADGLKTLIEAAVAQAGREQTAPYIQGNIDLTDKTVVEAADRKRFEFVNDIVKDVETRKVLTKDKNIGDKIDAVLTNKWLGIPIFAAVMFLVFHISQAEGPLGLGKWLEGILAGAVESFQGYIGELLANAHPLLQAIVVDGIIGGVVAVVGFLPLVMVMCFLIALLEDCGYMSRAAVVLDPIFKKVGLSGKSVIPFVITVGCAVPGIMAITKVAALAYLMFNLYTPPCFAAIGAMNSEMKSAKWLWGGIGLQLAVGYTVAYLVYTIGTLIVGGTLNVGAAIGGAIAVAAMIAVVVALIISNNKKMKSEYALKATK